MSTPTTGNLRSKLATLIAAASLVFCTLAASSAYAATPHIDYTDDTSACAACHTTHSATGSRLLAAIGGPVSPSDVCIGCHSSNDSSATNVIGGSEDSFSLQSGHNLLGETSGTAGAAITGCETCHNVHGSAETSRGIPAKIVNGTDVGYANRQLCYACHTNDADWFGPNYPSTSQPTRDATGFPIAGTWPGVDTYNSPSNAHGRIPESTQTVGVSQPFKREQGDCLYCHGAHGGRNEYDGLSTTFTVPVTSTLASDQADGSFAALCLDCHGGATPSGFTTAPVDIKSSVVASGFGGHRIQTAGGTLPVGSPMPCFECHNPHGSKRGNAAEISDERGGSLETSTAAGVRQFCFTCHTTSDMITGWDSDSSSYTAVSGDAKVVGLPRNGAKLHLPTTDGHSQDSTQSCYECHGNDYGADGYNVHRPNDGKSPLTAQFQFSILPSLQTSNSVDASGTTSTASETSATQTTASSSTISASFGPIATTTAFIVSDTTPPTTTSDATSSYVGTATITLTATDDSGGLGVAETYWSLDGATAQVGTVVTVSEVGSHTLTFWSVDLAGNVEAAQTVTFDVSASPPPPDSTASTSSAVSLLDLRPGNWIAGSA